MSRINRNAATAWLFFGLIAASVTAAVILDRSSRPADDGVLLPELVFPLIPLAFTFVGALIISRRPGNLIGLIMLLPGLSLFILVDAYLRPFINDTTPIPQPPDAIYLLIVWFSNWNWLLLVFPLMAIMVLFPTGRPLTRRWGWLNYFGLGLASLIIFLATFTQTLAPGSGEGVLSVVNPIGFIKADWVNPVILPAFFVALPLWVVLCALALVVRYRRSRPTERQQIKWLLFAVALFAGSYIPTFLYESFSDPESAWQLVWALGMLTIPIAIAIAILRYQLYDIDIIIRRTLLYSVVTALLALVYFGMVVVLQSVFESLSGQQSPLVIVISTLVIAALFSPLRNRIQTIIDRRFFRQKYDAQQVLTRFARTARDEVSLEALTAELTQVVQETIEPASLLLWLPKSNDRPK